MKILFIAPIPVKEKDNVSGQAKASKVLYDVLKDDHEVNVINLNKDSLKSGITSTGRIIQIGKLLKQVYNKRKNNDIIYISLAESFAGNMRDLFFYKIIEKDISKTFVHMLGGAGMKEILNKDNWQQKLNKKFLKKVAGVFVEGELNYEMFKKVIPEEKIHIVPNFADEDLFVTEQEVRDKFNDLSKINVLYLSNLINGKGYLELTDAYMELPEAYKEKMNISFVGGFENQEKEEEFQRKINDEQGISYLGKFIIGQEKRELYLKNQVFCLPTYYPFEGQPISILEAYATGNVVITTGHSGIPFVFKDQVNGFMVEKRSVDSLKNALIQLVDKKEILLDIALHNRKEALEKYRSSIFQKKLKEIIEKYSQ